MRQIGRESTQADPSSSRGNDAWLGLARTDDLDVGAKKQQPRFWPGLLDICTLRR
jgi:hypothetical protein